MMILSKRDLLPSMTNVIHHFVDIVTINTGPPLSFK